MITARVTTTGADEAVAFLVRLSATLEDRTELNKALGLRLTDELVDYFRAKNATGRQPGSLASRLNAPKTNFWNSMADATVLQSHDARQARVAVGTNHLHIHLFGGRILPGPGKKALTIPLVTEAFGRRAATYEAETGRKLFTIRGKKALFERTGEPGETGLVGRVRRRNGASRSVGLISRTGVRAVYALARSVTIQKDPSTLPPLQDLVTALQEEADQFLTRLQNQSPLT